MIFVYVPAMRWLRVWCWRRSSFYFDLQLMVFLFPVGLYYCFANLTDENIFIILYGVLSVYFAVSAASMFVDFSYLVY